MSEHGSVQEMVAAAMRSLLAAHWPAASAVEHAAAPAAIARVWGEMASQGFASVVADPDGGGLSACMAIARELGRAACPAPFIPAVIGGLLARDPAVKGKLEAVLGDGSIPLAIAFGPFDGDSDAGSARLAGGRLEGVVRFVEHCATARSVLAFVDGHVAAMALGGSAAAWTETPGLAVPALADVAFNGAPDAVAAVDNAVLDEAAAAARLLLVARAEGAARRAFELAADYVQERRQFGQALACFQSMQHKLADGFIALETARVMIEGAAEAFDRGDAWRFLADAAIAFCSAPLRKTSLETQHAFGAIGYAEAHEAPRHFRRVHADLCRMGGQTHARGALAAALLEGTGRLPVQHLGEQAEAFRAEVRAWLELNWTERDRAGERAKPFHERGWNEAFDHKLGAAGWLDQTWPTEVGGKGRPPLCQLALVEELTLAGASTLGVSASTWLIAPEIIRHGSPWLKDALLPGIRRGEIRFALGYSEPEAGSDLSSLRTRAVRDGDDYVINGQKMWGTGTERATHIAMAVRTDPDGKLRSGGISVILLPVDLPGVTIQPNMALYGHYFCTQFFDDVRVPAGYLLGAENQGWAVLGGALAAERIMMGGTIVGVQKIFEDLCAYVAGRADLRDDRRVRDMLGQFAAEIHAARALSLNSVRALQDGRLPLVEGAMAKVFSGDLTERLMEAALDILGASATLGEQADGAPLDGVLEQTLRRSIMLVIGGGAAEIQKTLIAQRGLGLPR